MTKANNGQYKEREIIGNDDDDDVWSVWCVCVCLYLYHLPPPPPHLKLFLIIDSLS